MRAASVTATINCGTGTAMIFETLKCLAQREGDLRRWTKPLADIPKWQQGPNDQAHGVLSRQMLRYEIMIKQRRMQGQGSFVAVGIYRASPYRKD